jgi:hypothetical protein
MSIQAAENISIQTISIDTDKLIAVIHEIQARAGEAAKAEAAGIVGKQAAAKIFTRATKKSPPEGHSFAFLSSRRAPLWDDNSGPNGWFIANSPGDEENRINLFHETENPVTLASRYLEFRNANIQDCFKEYVKSMKKKAETLSQEVDVEKDFIVVSDAFEKINGKIQGDENLESFGIGAFSFCQTWAKEEEDGNVSVGEQQFSVKAPHFQTRFYVKDEDTLRAKCKEIGFDFPEEQYIKIINRFTDIMEKKNYKGKFVNINELVKKLNTGETKEGGRRKTKRRKTKRRKTKKKRRKTKKRIKTKRKRRKRKR